MKSLRVLFNPIFKNHHRDAIYRSALISIIMAIFFYMLTPATLGHQHHPKMYEVFMIFMWTYINIRAVILLKSRWRFLLIAPITYTGPMLISDVYYIVDLLLTYPEI